MTKGRDHETHVELLPPVEIDQVDLALTTLQLFIPNYYQVAAQMTSVLVDTTVLTTCVVAIVER